MFLLRSAFWLSIAILMIPADPEAGTEAPRVTAIEALVAARATIADMSAFCDRNPDVCVTGSAALQLFGEKAQNGVRMLYRYFDQPAGDKVESEALSGTLTPADIVPPWRGPSADGTA